MVKVCFAVACKVIACNIKRWAKAFLSGKGIPGGVPASLAACVILWIDVIRETLLKTRFVLAMGFTRVENGTD